jgi:inorganic pyrophosphatase
MVDEAGSDAKVLAVPVEKLTPCYKKVASYEDISEDKLAKIAHFFQHYKDLEEGEILESIARYNATEAKPEF